jgi:molecular chaperone DnaK
MIIGIDLGTTHSLVSYIKDGSPRLIPNERGSRLTPSVVCFREDGEMIVGELAKNQVVLNAERTVANVKLSMGRNETFDIGGKTFGPVEISAGILKHLKSYAGHYLGREVRDAVITVPAYFDDRQREDTLRAAEMAGLNVLKLLNEPTAAALAYAFSQKLPSRLLVIDFGGGTLDITLMEYAEDVFRVRGVGGSTAIGGTDLDEAVLARIQRDFQSAHGIDLRKDSIAYQQLIIHAEKAKIDLSSTSETRIMIPYITVTNKGPVHLNMSLTREDLESLISPTLDLIERCVQDTFAQAGLEPGWVETVILVGGSTRIPAVEALVRRMLGVEKSGENEITPGIIKRNVNPDEAVARGAGILAGIFEGSVRNIEFHDIVPHDLGVEDDQGKFVTVMTRGTPYPADAFLLFTNTGDDPEEVRIHVLQRIGGENLVSLGWFKLVMDRPRKKGESNIDVCFSIDANGLLHVSATDLDTGKAGEITIEKVIL